MAAQMRGWYGNKGYRGAWSGTGTYGNRYDNRYSVLGSDCDTDTSTWPVQERSKRRRRSTGGSYGPGHGTGHGAYAAERGNTQTGQNQGQNQERSDTGAGAPGATGSPSVSSEFQIMDKAQFKTLSMDDKLVTMFETMTEKFGSMHGRMQTVETEVRGLNSKYEVHDSRIKLIEYKSIDLEARSRRNNLIFRGHPENVENDDCTSIIRRFLDTKLNIDPNVCIQRAHRLGAINRRGGRGRGRTQPRPIIVNFRDYEVVELIFDNAHRLRDTEYGINRDYPKEIIAARTKLWSQYKKAKSENPQGSVFFGYPAKLIVNKRVVADEFPDWRNVLRGSRSNDNNADVYPSGARNNSNGQEPNSHPQPSANQSANPWQSASAFSGDRVLNHPFMSAPPPPEPNDTVHERDEDEISMQSARSRASSRDSSPIYRHSMTVSPDRSHSEAVISAEQIVTPAPIMNANGNMPPPQTHIPIVVNIERPVPPTNKTDNADRSFPPDTAKPPSYLTTNDDSATSASAKISAKESLSLNASSNPSDPLPKSDDGAASVNNTGTSKCATPKQSETETKGVSKTDSARNSRSDSVDLGRRTLSKHRASSRSLSKTRLKQAAQAAENAETRVKGQTSK